MGFVTHGAQEIPQTRTAESIVIRMKPHPVNARCGAFDCAYKISEMYPAGHLYRIPSSSYNYQKALSGGEISLDGSDYSPCMYELVISEQDRPKYYAVIKKTVTLNI